MRSPEYQLGMTKYSIERWLTNVEQSIRILKEDQEWTYLHLVNLQEDVHLLYKFIEQYLVIQLMRDADETAWKNPYAPVAQTAEAPDSKSG